MKIFSTILMVISPTAVFAAWETNMPRGVTPTSEIAYDLHMLIFYKCFMNCLKMLIFCYEKALHLGW